MTFRRTLMKQDKKFKSNIKYFTKSEILKYIGVGLVILSVAIYFIDFFCGWFAYLILILGLPAGIVLFLISTGRASDDEINTYIKLHTKGIGEEVEDEKNFRKRLLDRQPPIVFEGHDFEDGVMITKAKNGSLVSSVFTKAIIFPLDTGIHVSYRTISLISDEIKEDSFEIGYSDISSFKMNDEKKQIVFGKKKFTPHDIRLVINYSGVKTISLPMQDNMDTENFIKKINEMMAKAKEAK